MAAEIKLNLGNDSIRQPRELAQNVDDLSGSFVGASNACSQVGTIAKAIKAAHGEEPSIESQQPNMKFIRLRDQWKKQRRHESSTIKMVTLPAYQTIIGMGPAALPFLLRELENNLDAWFWALRAITEEDPVPEDLRGDGAAMAQAWLDWARSRGIRW